MYAFRSACLLFAVCSYPTVKIALGRNVRDVRYSREWYHEGTIGNNCECCKGPSLFNMCSCRDFGSGAGSVPVHATLPLSRANVFASNSPECVPSAQDAKTPNSLGKARARWPDKGTAFSALYNYLFRRGWRQWRQPFARTALRASASFSIISMCNWHRRDLCAREVIYLSCW